VNKYKEDEEQLTFVVLLELSVELWNDFMKWIVHKSAVRAGFALFTVYLLLVHRACTAGHERIYTLTQ